MGVASYRRGSAAISFQFQMDAWERGATNINPNAVPAPVVPRPADWGSKALARAEKVAAGSFRFGQQWPAHAITFDQAVEVVMERARCGRETAERAVEAAGYVRAGA